MLTCVNKKIPKDFFFAKSQFKNTKKKSRRK